MSRVLVYKMGAQDEEREPALRLTHPFSEVSSVDVVRTACRGCVILGVAAPPLYQRIVEHYTQAIRHKPGEFLPTQTKIQRER